MPNGRAGDDPLTDLFHHGAHPFPPDVEHMLLELHRLDPGCLRHLDGAELAWEQGRGLEEARLTLRALLEQARHAS